MGLTQAQIEDAQMDADWNAMRDTTPATLSDLAMAYQRVKQTLSHYEQTDGTMRFTAESIAAELRRALYGEE